MHNPYEPPISASTSQRPSYGGYRSIEGLARTLTWWLWIYVGLLCVEALAASLHFANAPARPPGGYANPDDVPLSSWDWAALLAWLATFGTLVACAVIFATLSYRSNINARAFDSRPVRFSPAAMVWWYFVPFANLFKPYEAMREVYLASFPKGEPATIHPRLTSWWALWVSSNLVGSLGFRIAPETTVGQISVVLLMLPLDVGASILAMVVTRALAYRQARTAAVMYPSEAT